MATGDQLVAVKTATTSRTTTTTPTLDPDLQMTVAANTSYIFECFLGFGTAQTSRMIFAAPTTTRDYSAGVTMAFVTTDITNPNNFGQTDSGSAIAFSTTRFNLGFSGRYYFAGQFTVGGSGGTFGVSWAQNASSATASELFVGSSLRVTEV